MTSFFNNPNVASAVVERLPCAFATAVNGKMGTHYAMVLLDKKANVIYVGSECEDKHGEGIQAFHDMGDGQQDTCYIAAAAFRKALAKLRYKGGLGHLVDVPREARQLPLVLEGVFNKVWEQAVNRHNERYSVRVGSELYEQSSKLRVLEHTVNRVACNVLDIAPGVHHGNFPERIQKQHLVLGGDTYPPVFNVVLSALGTDTCCGAHWYEKLGAGPHPMLYFWDHSIPVAVRYKGSWVLAEDAIKAWAVEHCEVTSVRRHVPYQDPRRACIFCKEEFKRMSKHLVGAKHIDQVVNLVKLVCKATTRMGLHMLNDPRQRHVFIR